MGNGICKGNCNLCTKSRRSCDNEFISIISKGKCGEYCSNCQQSSLNCDGKFVLWEKQVKNNPYIQTFKPYFDVTLGKEVTSKREINEYCKRNNMVYAGDKELTQQCAQNKAENERRFNERFEAGLRQELLRRL